MKKNLNCMELYLNEIAKYPLLTKEEEYRLIGSAQEGNIESRNRLVEGNLRLVAKISRRFSNIDFDDAMQTGTLGLLKAIDHFDVNRGTKFATCAYDWIFQSIQCFQRDLTQTIRLPAHVQEGIAAVKKAEAVLEKDLHSPLVVAEIAAKTGFSEERICNIQRAREVSTTSLEDILSDDKRQTRIGVIEDPCAVNPYEKSLKKERSERIRDLLDCLSERERVIILYSYGFVDGKMHSLRELGKMLSLSSERCRQIRQAALQKLKRMGKDLQVFLEE